MALSPPRVRERLRGSVDPVRSVLLSPTWDLRRPFVGRIGEHGFALRVRHGSSNGLTRIACARLHPTPSGTRIEVEFRTLRVVVAILRAAWIGILLMALPLVREVSRSTPTAGALALSLLAPAGVLAFLVGVEAIARSMGRRDEQRLREHHEGLFADAVRRS